ncbi:MAG: PIN domain-containing protein [Myxococcales bacterium]|nr:PIN domain-containing protein [Myxococcales bacterium]
MAGLTLDAGALIGFERCDRRVVGLLTRALARGLAIAIPAAVIAQVWRRGDRQARLSRLLAAPEVEVVPLDGFVARQAGVLCGVRGTSDVVDASVALCARARGHRVVTADADDLRALDPGLAVIEI